MKKRRDTTHPRRSPTLTWNGFDYLPFTQTQSVKKLTVDQPGTASVFTHLEAGFEMAGQFSYGNLLKVTHKGDDYYRFLLSIT